MTLLYNDFDYFTSTGGGFSTIAGVLRYAKTGGPSDSPISNFCPITTHPQGVTTGILTVDLGFTNTSNSQAAGLICMQSQRNMSTGGGQGYGVRYHTPGSVGTLTLLKFTAGIALSTVLDSAVIGSMFGLALRWAVVPDFHGIVLFGGYYGTPGGIITFPISSQQFAPYLSTSVTEGGFYDDGGAGSGFTMTYDNMVLKGP